MRILLDCDGVLADAMTPVVQALGKTVEDLTTHDFAGCMTATEVVQAYFVMSQEGFARGLRWYPGASLVSKVLHQYGEVMVVTAHFKPSRTWMQEREEWLEAGGLNKVIFTSHKYAVKGDILVEDYDKNLRNWLAEHPTGFGILVDRPWNRDVKLPARCTRVHDLLEIVDIVERRQTL